MEKVEHLVVGIRPSRYAMQCWIALATTGNLRRSPKRAPRQIWTCISSIVVQPTILLKTYVRKVKISVQLSWNVFLSFGKGFCAYVHFHKCLIQNTGSTAYALIKSYLPANTLDTEDTEGIVLQDTRKPFWVKPIVLATLITVDKTASHSLRECTH